MSADRIATNNALSFTPDPSGRLRLAVANRKTRDDAWEEWTLPIIGWAVVVGHRGPDDEDPDDTIETRIEPGVIVSGGPVLASDIGNHLSGGPGNTDWNVIDPADES